jgi:SulP family sulfate permease
VKLDELQRLREASRLEFRIALMALVGVLAFGLLEGLLLAALGSLIVLLLRASRPAVVTLARDGAGRFVNRERLATVDDIPGVLIARTAGAWVYFNADHIRHHILDLVDHAASPVRTVILDCSMVPNVDFNAASTLCNLSKSLATRGTRLQLAELRDDVVDELRSRGIETALGPLTAHKTIEDCL